MKRKLIFKTILLTAALFVGANAVFGQTTLYERGTTNAWAATDVANGKWSAGTIGTNGLEVTNGVASSLTIAPTSDTSTLTWTTTWNPGNATGTANNTNAYIQFGDIKFAFYGSSWFTKVTIGSTTTQLSGGGATRSRDYVITVTINQSTNEVSYTFDDNGTKLTGTGTTASAGSFTTLTHGLGGKAPSWTNTAILKKVEVTEKENTTATANYTVRYLCGETVVKDAVTRVGEVGAGITLQATDKEDLYNGDNSIKYVYSFDNASEVTVASDGSTVVTVNYEAKAKITYTVNAVLANESVLGEIASVSGYEGETLDVFWSKYAKFGETWYITSETTFRTAETEAGSKNVVYTQSDIAYFFEMEKLTRSGGSYLTEESASYSGKNRLRISRGSMHYTPALSAGIYKLSIPWANTNGSANEVYVYTRTSGGELSDVLETFTATGASSGTFTYTITVPEGYSIAFKGNEGGSANNNARMDYMTLSRVVAVTIPASSEPTGYASLSSAFPLDCDHLPSGVKAYKVASINKTDKKVVLAEVNGTVKAETGLIISGTPGETYNIPVAASGSAVDGNLLKAAVTDTEVAADQAYGLKDGKFVKLNAGNVPAGKAYLLASDIQAPELDIDFGGVTAITNTNRTNDTNIREIYNINGQRIAQPTKGLYIVNGKKVIMK